MAGLSAAQCRRIGIQVNYAPVVDINNNPDNPVINDRSFGEDKKKVAEFGIQYMRGLQDMGVMACAKHFPGHGDVAVDSHLDLPVINKDRKQLDSLELYPFRQLFAAGVGSVMIAHLYIPAIDKTPNRATSLSYENVTRLLRKQLHLPGHQLYRCAGDERRDEVLSRWGCGRSVADRRQRYVVSPRRCGAQPGKDQDRDPRTSSCVGKTSMRG